MSSVLKVARRAVQYHSYGQDALVTLTCAVNRPLAHAFWFGEAPLLLYAELSEHGVPLLGVRARWLISEVIFRVMVLGGANPYLLVDQNKRRLGYLVPSHLLYRHIRHSFVVRSRALVKEAIGRLMHRTPDAPV